MYAKNVNSDATDLLENLIPKDREETIDNRGLKPEWVAANCRSVTAKQATELLGYPAKSSGIWLQGSGYQCQFRPHKPWRSTKDTENSVTKAPKYRTPQEYDGEYDAILPTHPENINFWHRKETIATNCYKINEHPCLVITEGVFKAIKLFGDGGIPTISLLGVEMGLSSRKQDPEGRRYLVKSLQKYADLGFGFVIAFDADCATNPNVIRAQKRLARQLESYNVPVYSITGLWKVEDGKGLDDYIQKHGIDKFVLNILSKAIPHEEWEEQQAQRTPNAPPQADEIYTQQALSALYGEGHWMAVGGILHKWTGTHYQALGTESERRRIAQWCFSHSVAKGDRWISSYATETHVNNIWGWVLVWFGVDGDQLNPPGINCLNGRLVITWDGGTPHWELKPHNPLDYYTYCAAFHYDQNADSTECDRLLDCLDAPQRKILLQTIAASLDLGHLRQYLDRVRCLILLGHGRNGKDAIRFATEIIYGEALSDASLGDFMRYDQGTKNALAKLAGSRVNWPSENTRFSNIDNIQCLKAIITGNVFHVKLLFKEEAKAVSQAVYLFNVNEAPSLEAGLEAIKSRYSIIKFNKTYAKNADPKKGELEADPRFTYSRDWVSKNVVPALINKLFAELTTLASDGIDYSSTEKALEEVQQETNHLWAFAHESGLQYQVGGRVYIKDLWAKLQEWYLENGTLVINTDGGKEKREWYELANARDKPCKKDNVLAPRFKELFPKVERKIETCEPSRKGQAYLAGLAFSASPASPIDTERVPASPTSSLGESPGEAETLTHRASEAGEADLTPLAVSEKTDLNPPPTAPPPRPPEPIPATHPLAKYLTKLPKAYTWKIVDGRTFELPADYPGLLSYGQVKEPLQIKKLLLKIQSKEDWDAIVKQYGDIRPRWVWRWLLTQQERTLLKPLCSGDTKQLDLDSLLATEQVVESPPTEVEPAAILPVASETIAQIPPPQTGKFKVGDRVRSHRHIGTILEVNDGSVVTVYWDDVNVSVKMDQSFLSGETAEGGELLPAPRGVVNYLSLKPGDRLRILRHAKHKKSWWQQGGKIATVRATRINPKTNELEANAEIAGEGLPCTLSLDAVEVVEGDRTSAIADLKRSH